MATIRNPINPNTIIDLTPALDSIPFAYGQYTNSGLFTERGIVSSTALYKVKETKDTKMTKLTSRTERDAMAVERSKDKYVTMGSITIKETGGVHVEDLIGVSAGSFSMESESFQDATVQELTRLANVAAANKEYLITTATQGKVLDPLDGSVAIDQFANTGTSQTTFTIDANPSNNITKSLNELSNLVAARNGNYGNIATIEVVLGEQAFDSIVNHPDFAAMYQMAFTGLGSLALAQPVVNGSAGQQMRNQYGYRREFRWNNFLFVTYPRKFTRWNGEQVDAVAGNKGWTIVHGVADLYIVNYAPAPYVSTYNKEGQAWYARSTGIVDDTHADMTLESHLIPYMKRPEMAIDITVATA